jgi:signal transduction histidine kinase
VLTNSQDLLEGVLAVFRAHILASKITLLVQIRCSRALSVHPGEIRQVFSNLIANALDAIGPRPGQLRVRCFETYNYRTQSHGVRFAFSDSGTGIPNEVYPRIFDAFYTTKELKGSGVGLWLSSEVIGKHKGTIRVPFPEQSRSQ